MTNYLALDIQERRWLWMMIILAVFMQIFLSNWLVPFVPATIFLPLVLVWTLRSAAVPITIIAIIAEFTSTLPFGLLAASCFVPFLMNKVKGRLTPSLSFRFIMFLFVTTLIQLLIILLPHLFTESSWTSIPLWQVFNVAVATTLAALGAIAWYQSKLKVQPGADISLTRRRYG